MDTKIFEYGKSFVLTKDKKVNSPRFLIEAKCTIGNNDYYLCASCKGEKTYARKNLFASKTPFDFLPIIGKDYVLIFKRFPFFNSKEKVEYKKAHDGLDLWGEKEFVLSEVKPKELLDTPEKISSAVQAGNSIMARISFKKNDKQITIDFPIKTININRKQWQVDTGPVPYPNLDMVCPYEIFTMNPAYIAFNSFDFVEFIVEDMKELLSGYSAVGDKDIVVIKKPEIYLYSL